MSPFRNLLVSRRWWLAVVLVVVGGPFVAAQEVKPIQFELSFTESVSREPLTARVYVMFASALGSREPRTGPDWFRPQPFFAVEAKNWKPGETLKIDTKAAGFPSALDNIDVGNYRAQAVIRLNVDTHALDGDGNAYSPVQVIKIDHKAGGTFSFVVDKIATPKVRNDTDRIKYVSLKSEILSEFHKRPIYHRAAVHLPEGDRSINRPALYIIPGFGGDESMIAQVANDYRFAYAKDMIRVVLNPDCGTGHHVFADSATNGPRGEALIKEFIPYLEKTLNAVPKPDARLLNGHSSGGWSSLWLQVTYPDFFGGVWSTSPDPVTFSDFQQIDLNADKMNMYRQDDGSPRPIARIGERPALFFEPFARMEEVLGAGGQLSSFEAVFSPLDDAGRPRKLWNRATGAIDRETAGSWGKYDITNLLVARCRTLPTVLKGKIHIVMGDLDTFYLNGATEKLKQRIAPFGYEAEITISPKKDHFNVITPEVVKQFNEQMNKTVKAYLPEPKKDAK